jgi:hypothetical protein
MDEYQRRARLYPTLLTILPATVFATVAVETPPAWWRAVSGLAASAGAIYLVTHVGRTLGRRRQEELFRSWGGEPTTVLLRFRGTDAPERVAWFHSEPEAAVGKRLPTHDEEINDPAQADALYDAAVARFRELRRDKKRFPLIFAENCSYGFRRNLFGLRIVGVSLALAVALASATLFVFSLFGRETIAISGLLFSLGVALAALAFCAWLVTPRWVREAADAYAERLLLSASQP